MDVENWTKQIRKKIFKKHHACNAYSKNQLQHFRAAESDLLIDFQSSSHLQTNSLEDRRLKDDISSSSF